MSPSKDSQSDALNDWNAETYYYDSIRLYGRECQLQDNLSLLKKCPRHTDHYDARREIKEIKSF